MTDKEIRKRNRAIARAVESGIAMAEVCTQFTVPATIVYGACSTHGVVTPVTRMVAERDRKIAKAARAGADYATLCATFSVPYHAVRDACLKHGVQPARTPAQIEKRDVFWRALADLLNTNDSLAAIGKRHQMSKQRVHQLCAKAREFGLPLKSSRKRVTK